MAGGGAGGGSLQGLLVADFSRVLSGPLATMVLGDLGAEVVKVERPETGDDTRGWGPPFTADGQSTYFLAANRNKSSRVLDLGSEEGRARALDLALGADVVVENFRPGTMDRLGLGYDRLHEDNPGLVFCSISGFGTGPGARLPGYDFLVQALGGLMSVTGEPDGPPLKVGVALVDVVAGLFAAVGILAALRERERTGQGQLVEIDLLSSLLAALVNQSSAYAAAGVVPTRMGNEHPSIAPYETLQAADGPLVVAVGNDGQFARLCEALGRPGLATDERFATNRGRVEHRPALRAALEEALSARGATAWVQVLGDAGVPCGQVNDMAGAFALADRLGLSPLVRMRRADGTEVGQVASPIRLSRTPVRYDRPPPRLGDA